MSSEKKDGVVAAMVELMEARVSFELALLGPPNIYGAALIKAKTRVDNEELAFGESIVDIAAICKEEDPDKALGDALRKHLEIVNYAAQKREEKARCQPQS